jgi:hypothetical protein
MGPLPQSMPSSALTMAGDRVNRRRRASIARRAMSSSGVSTRKSEPPRGLFIREHEPSGLYRVVAHSSVRLHALLTPCARMDASRAHYS